MTSKKKSSSVTRSLKHSDDNNDTVIERLPMPLYGNYVSAKKLNESEVTMSSNVHYATPADQIEKLGRCADKGNLMSISSDLNEAAGKDSGLKDLLLSDRESSEFSSVSTQDADVSIMGTLPSDHTSIFNSERRRVSIVGPVQRPEIPVILPQQQSPADGHQTIQTSSPTLVGSLPGCTGVHLVPANEWMALQHELKVVGEEKDLFHKQLAVQIKVNSDLKKLLVASVGDDLHVRVDRLARDKAELTEELGDKDRQVSEGCESLDQVSIQADLWRTKYLASRVQLDEHAMSRAFLTTQYAEAQDALHEMLSERYEVRSNLLETHRLLRQICRAFDPLNSRSMNTLTELASTNMLELSRGNLRLAEAVRFRLLPPSSSALPLSRDSNQWEDNMTPAETLANEMLSRSHESLPTPTTSTSTMTRPVTMAAQSPFTRYHPHVRYDNLTVNCCPTCEGEIKLV